MYGNSLVHYCVVNCKNPYPIITHYQSKILLAENDLDSESINERRFPKNIRICKKQTTLAALTVSYCCGRDEMAEAREGFTRDTRPLWRHYSKYGPPYLRACIGGDPRERREIRGMPKEKYPMCLLPPPIDLLDYEVESEYKSEKRKKKKSN